jgi:tetratricopeptide (TPR) repeat protein
MGVVYEVHDRARDEIVALKTLRRASAADLYRLKREFRSLADVTHPNLACLYELFVENDCCFFTMELVKGVSFVDYVQGADPMQPFQERLIDALRQLVDGISALHGRGKLHRDIKPSNVLVTDEGRVVVLDFGLIAELLPHHTGDANFESGGTPAYMAPEEAAGKTPSEAGDWYGIGVTLYETLTGTIPFVGRVADVLLRKRTCDPPAPSELAPHLRDDLSAICMGLMCRDPRQRLTGPEALRRLNRGVAFVASETTGAPIRDTPFVGRARPLQALNDVFRVVARGGAMAVSVHGPSGIGKSALIRRFLSQFSPRDDVVVVSGRCYENESVPYKALDGVIDDLSRYLESIPVEHVRQLLPPAVPALTRLFPVLLQVRAIADARGDGDLSIADPLAHRQRAFEALRELFGRLANRQAVVIWIDDLQWADADSVVLLEELLRPPDAPAMLTVLCFRSEEIAAKAFLQALLERAGRDRWSSISLGPMTDEEAERLVGALLPANAVLTEQDRRRVTQEARGSPLVLEQLCLYASLSTEEPRHAPTFPEMFETRLMALSPDARRFLEMLAVCGRPMAPELICNACGVTRERQSLVAMLRSMHFIRSSGSSERIEPYHDRIREALATRMPPEAVRRTHGVLAQALVARQPDECEALFEHYRGAGDFENASIQAGLAAARATTALAFDRAASFFRDALLLSPASPSTHTWREGLASALANAGRSADAGEAYLQAAAAAGPAQRVEFQRHAAEQFLIGGHMDRGLELIRTMLAGMGMGLPKSARRALVSLLWQRARLRWRGFHFVMRAAGEIDAETLLRADTCWSATTGLLLVDMISAFSFSARHLLMTLEAGEPYRLARAMAIESAARAAYPSGRTLSRKLIQQSKVLAENLGHPHAIALSLVADGGMAIAVGEWKKALTLSEEALAMLRNQCGVTWETNTAQNLVIWALMYLGELAEVSKRVPVLLARARSCGNLYLATELCTRSNFAWLTADNPDEGERVATESIARWSHTGVHRQHYSAMLARIQTALYRGNPDGAWRLLTELEVILQRTYLTRVQVMRIESHYLRARSALAMAALYGSQRRFLSVARASARRIAGERMGWSDPIALLLRAGIAYLDDDRPRALSCLHEAVDRFDRADMKLYAAVARRRIGALQGDASARAIQRRAEEWMDAQHIRNPTAMTRMLAPGFPGLQ